VIWILDYADCNDCGAKKAGHYLARFFCLYFCDLTLYEEEGKIVSIGSSALYWLSRAGVDVLGLEPFHIGHLFGGSQDHMIQLIVSW